MKVVIDTNVWISGLLSPTSLPGQIIQAWRSNDFQVFVSSVLLAEIHAVLHYPKIAKRLKLSPDEINEFIELLALFTDRVDIETTIPSVLRDPNDQHLLDLFVAARADCLISGDQDLLVLAPTFNVLSPQQFYEQYCK